MDGHHAHVGGGTGHRHNGAASSFSGAFRAVTLLNVLLVAMQVGFGIAAGSIALMADAAHNLGDALGIVLAWAAYVAARWHPTERYTYGFRSASILAALANGSILLITAGAIVWEAIRRFSEPVPVAGLTVMVVAALAVMLNGLAALILSRGSKQDLNIRGAFLHMLADAGVSLGVVIAGGLVFATGWNWVDPATSLLVCGVVIWGTWGWLREALTLSLLGVPAAIEPKAVRCYLLGLPGVIGVHDLHIWPMSTTETALTCHLVMKLGTSPRNGFVLELKEQLQHRFGIEHPTIQIETHDEANRCQLAPAHVL